MSGASQPDGGTGSLVLVCAGVFGLFTAVSMIGPVLVDVARDLDVPVGRAGLLATFMAVPWALGSPFAGLLSDRLGRRPMIVLALGGVGVMFVGMAFARSFLALAVLRFLAGIVGSCGPTSLMASVGDLFAPERRARAMGWFNMGFSLAAVGGVPAVGAVGGLFGWRIAFATTGVGLVLLAVIVRIAFPSGTGRRAAESRAGGYRDVLRVPRLLNLLSANLAERSMFAMMVLYLPAFLMLRYRMGAAEIAPFLAVVAVGTIGGNVLGGWLGDRLPKLALFIVAQLVASVIGLALLGLGLPFATAIALAALFGLANAASRPGFLAFLSELVPRQRGALFGLFGLTNQGGVVLGSALGGVVIDLAGYTGLGVVAVCQAGVAAPPPRLGLPGSNRSLHGAPSTGSSEAA